jgi:hypothetical protein
MKTFCFALGLWVTASASSVSAGISALDEAAQPANPPRCLRQSFSPGPAHFLVAGDSGAGLISTDGVHWTPHAVLVATNWRSLCHGNGTYLAVGTDGRLRSSKDGVVWTLRDAGVPFALHRVAMVRVVSWRLAMKVRWSLPKTDHLDKPELGHG